MSDGGLRKETGLFGEINHYHSVEKGNHGHKDHLIMPEIDRGDYKMPLDLRSVLMEISEIRPVEAGMMRRQLGPLLLP